MPCAISPYDNVASLSSLNGSRLALIFGPAWDCQGTTTRAGADGFRARELKMQLLLLVGSIVLSVGAALGTASLFLSLLLRIMSKLR